MGLSGLARSFFYAGARSLLASHWPVRDDVAAVLTVEVLKQQQAHPNYSRAEALRAAMKAIRDDPRVDGKEDTWAHPSAWAPFTFVGDWKN
jgi:CHAT domain-containing protein